ncbi:MAG: FAD-dependent oxidoreductase [Proteobacteria bacterium]|nr:FAD-dependent oxidoreductase [Pseudomonadota bacterium]
MSHVVIVGAGPAGASLAGLLAHRGIEVTLLERRRDFAREFRGEVLMPSGIEALEQMGVVSLLQTIPTHTQRAISLYMNGRTILKLNLEEDAFDGRLPMAVSQPALLEALVAHAQRSSHFRFMRGVSVKDLLMQNSRVSGTQDAAIYFLLTRPGMNRCS